MTRTAFVIFSCFFAFLGISTGAARAGDYYYGGSAYSHGGYENGYYGERSYGRYYHYGDDDYGAGYYGHRYYGNGNYRYGGGHYGYGPARDAWTGSHCCYRRIVRHERSVHYERLYSDYGYDGRSYDDGGRYDDDW